MLVKDVMKSPVVTVCLGVTVAEVSRLFEENGISGAPVVDDNGRLKGVVSEFDLIRKSQELRLTLFRDPFRWVSPHATVEAMANFSKGLCTMGVMKVEDVMTRKVVTVKETDSLEDVTKIMAGKRINRLPVVSDGKVVGIITRGDMLAAMARLCEVNPGLLE